MVSSSGKVIPERIALFIMMETLGSMVLVVEVHSGMHNLEELQFIMSKWSR